MSHQRAHFLLIIVFNMSRWWKAHWLHLSIFFVFCRWCHGQEILFTYLKLLVCFSNGHAENRKIFQKQVKNIARPNAMKRQQQRPLKIKTILVDMEVSHDAFIFAITKLDKLCNKFINKLFSLKLSYFDKILLFTIIICFFLVCTVAIIRCHGGNNLFGSL